jgi:hypothetical protein
MMCRNLAKAISRNLLQALQQQNVNLLLVGRQTHTSACGEQLDRVAMSSRRPL